MDYKRINKNDMTTNVSWIAFNAMVKREFAFRVAMLAFMLRTLLEVSYKLH